MQTYGYARAALWDTAIKFSLQSRAMTSPDHLDIKEVQGKPSLHVSVMSTYYLEYGPHFAVAVAVVVARTRPRAMLLAMTTIENQLMGFLFFPI